MSRLLRACLLLFAIFAALAIPPAAPAQIAVGVSIRIGPPALPVYPQPICPGPGYIWTPGYWAYGPDGYYWVPGTWVVAPVGMLWTPGYWGWSSGFYAWHAGYWGPHVGFYGGINYGYGYGGVGFVGGEWRGRVFAYNTAVTNVNTTVIHNTYVNNTVVNKTVVNNVSYNGGTGGITAQPNAAERSAANEHHVAPLAAQTQHEHSASQNHALLASVNHGRPQVAATSRPGEFTGHGVTAAHAGGISANRPAPSNKTNANVTNRPPNSSNTMNRPAVSNDRPPNAGQQSHGTQNQSHVSQPNTSHPSNQHPSTPHPSNDRPNVHQSNPRPSGGQGHDRPGR